LGLQIICPPSVGIEAGTYTWITPSFFVKDDTQVKVEQGVDTLRFEFLNSVASSYESYLFLRQEGIKPEDARMLLPNATKTEVEIADYTDKHLSSSAYAIGYSHPARAPILQSVYFLSFFIRAICAICGSLQLLCLGLFGQLPADPQESRRVCMRRASP
jgi:hypothetical protein